MGEEEGGAMGMQMIFLSFYIVIHFCLKLYISKFVTQLQCKLAINCLNFVLK